MQGGFHRRVKMRYELGGLARSRHISPAGDENPSTSPKAKLKRAIGLLGKQQLLLGILWRCFNFANGGRDLLYWLL